MRIFGKRITLPLGTSSLVAVVSGLVGATITSAFQDRAASAIVGDKSWTPVLILVSMAVLCLLMLRMTQRVDELHRQHRLSIEYYPVADPEEPLAGEKLYQAARRIVEGVKADGNCEILAVNCFAERFAPWTNAPVKAAHAEFFRALEAKLGKIDYHRIIQYPTTLSSGDLGMYVSDVYQEHFANVIAFRDQKGKHRAKVDRVPPLYPTAYVVIKNGPNSSHLIWQLNEYEQPFNSATHVFRPRGVLVIQDPDRQLIQYFETWFNHLANSDDLRALQRSDLTVTSPPGSST